MLDLIDEILSSVAGRTANLPHKSSSAGIDSAA